MLSKIDRKSILAKKYDFSHGPFSITILFNSIEDLLDMFFVVGLTGNKPFKIGVHKDKN